MTFHDFVIVRNSRQKRQCVFLQEVICQQPTVKSDPKQPVFAEECYLMTIICVCSGPVCEETLNKSAALECESVLRERSTCERQKNVRDRSSQHEIL